VQAKDKTRSAK